MKKLLLPLAIASTVFVSGCASSQKVQVVQPGDNKLTCEELKSELAQVDQITAANNKNKGVTGTNVAAALFFWPALAYTYIDAGEAEKLAQERKSHLTSLYNEKDC